MLKEKERKQNVSILWQNYGPLLLKIRPKDTLVNGSSFLTTNFTLVFNSVKESSAKIAEGEVHEIEVKLNSNAIGYFVNPSLLGL